MEEYKDLRKYSHSWHVFNDHGSLKLLTETISSFFSCKVEAFPNPSRQLKEKYNIDIHANIRRGCYPIGNDEVIIVGRVLKELELISAIGFSLQRQHIAESISILNTFESSLTRKLTKLFSSYFKDGTLELGEELVIHVLTNHLSKGYYDYRQVRHCIEYFQRLRTTSFEGSFFSTGLIITKSFHEFERKKGAYRFGDVYELTKPFSLMNTNHIDKRMWYLADGKKTFFLGNKNLLFTRLFIVDGEYSSHNYLDSHSLSLTLKGGDALFKIENEKLFSVNTAEGFEFAFVENQWKFRDYNVLHKLLSTRLSSDPKLIDALIFYILQCSKSGTSTIMWFPDRMDEIDLVINAATKNRFITHEISISDRRFINHILRYLGSDGATVFSKNGHLIHYGVIVDINKATISGVKGTGESAASVLSSNGLAIKISQDGTIKIFESPDRDPLKF